MNAVFLGRRVVKVRVLDQAGTVFAERVSDESRVIGRIFSKSKKIIMEERVIGSVEVHFAGGSMEAC